MTLRTNAAAALAVVALFMTSCSAGVFGGEAMDDDTATAEERAEAARQGELEAEFTESNMPGNLYEDAAATGSPSPTGMALESALDSAGPSLLDPLRVISVRDNSEAGTIAEQVMYGDGSRTGYVMVSWQTLRGDENVANFVGEFGYVRSEGPLNIIIDVRDDVGLTFRVVRVYDEAKIVSVSANDIVGLEDEDLIPLAKQIFGLLPE